MLIGFLKSEIYQYTKKEFKKRRGEQLEMNIGGILS